MRKKLLSLVVCGEMLISVAFPLCICGTAETSAESEFSEEEISNFANGFYSEGRLVYGADLCNALTALESDSHSFKLAVNQMNLEQSGSLEKAADCSLKTAVSESICHSGYSTSEPVILKKKSLLKANKSADSNDEPVWPAEGSIYLSKNAKSIESEENKWEVELQIKGKNYKTTSDVVLVIDCSGSMSGSKLKNTRIAAIAFGRKLLTENSATRIALVTYSDTAMAYDNGHFYTSDELDLFNSAVDSAAYSNGGTNQQAGIHLADSLLYSSSSVGVQKNMVILSDGEPTFSYPFSGGNLGRHNALRFDSDWITDYPTTAIADYSHIIGSGGDFELGSGNIRWTWHNIFSNYSNLYGSFYYDANGNFVCSNGQKAANNGCATVWEAGNTKQKGTTVYSVALQAGENGENVLRSCSSDWANKYYAIGEKDNVEEKLTTALENIAGNISIAASKGIVTDPMGEHIDLHFDGSEPVCTNDQNTYEKGNADIYISQGTASYNKQSEIISWNVGNVNEGNDPVMRYRVKVDSNYSAQDGEVLDVNGTTTLSYINHLQEQSQKEFPIPKVTVSGGQILVHWYRVNENGEPVNKNGEKVDSPSLAEQLDIPAYFEYDGSTGLKLNTEYIIKPRDFSDKDYEYFRYAIGNGSLTEGNEVRVTLTSSQSSQQVWFAYKPEENCSITVKKIGAEQIDQNQSFLFHLKGIEQKTKGINLMLCINSNGFATVKDIPTGEYEITECTDWSWRYTPTENSKKVNAAEKENMVVFRNQRDNNKWLNGNDYCKNTFSRAVS